MLKEFWVIFDTCQYPEYYQDVHNLVAMPEGTIMRYEYKNKYLSDAARQLANNSPKEHQVLFVYAQKDCKYIRVPGNSRPPDGTYLTLYIGTRLGTMLNVTKDGESYYFDFQVTKYPKDDPSTLNKILEVLIAKNEVPWEKWVCVSRDLASLKVLQDGDQHKNWSAIVNSLSSPPMQFEGDAFWRLKGPYKRPKEILRNPMVEFITENGYSRQARSYYDIVENETWRFELLSETGKSVTEASEGTVPHREYSVRVRSSNDNILSPIGMSVYALRHYSGQMVEYSARTHPFFGRPVADLIFETEPRQGEWPVGANIRFKHKLRRNRTRMTVGTIVGLFGMGCQTVGNSSLFEQHQCLKMFLIVAGTILIVISMFVLTGQIKLST